MQGEHEEELRTLRARAYGPSPDIHADAVAVARLEELEAAARQRDAGPPARAANTEVERVAPAEAVAAPETELFPEATASAPPASPPARRARPRWAAVLWPVSVVAALSAGAAATSLAMPLVSRDAGAGASQVTTLQPDPGFEWPEGLFGPPTDDAQGFADFLGVTAIASSRGAYQPGGDSACLLLIPTEDLAKQPETGFTWVHSGCGAGPFPAAVALTVDGQMPESLRDRFPVGTALQFVFDGERVGVFAEATE
ncbi:MULTISPECIES: hypothetical protein [Microbacterium]|uniref:Spermidine/putrescine ABC transporter permease n=1 Tax=Microbacterium wangchenii TaxID=2541726 RepID=A0ABX5SU12_9MICO|nr:MULTISPECIES: hypothetical protein [Microbacterium]MCK6067397.1 hypothetical protein [Microbacterium sp. EYE_512]QBR89666.1 hypothetical protein E4K62_13855 [Microbacterium wangchenii]TXK16736.1 hypothetical protein FVP99_08660 [Microbacterium wangchenii]